MRHQQAILSQRITNLQKGIDEASRYLHTIDTMLGEKDNFASEDIEKIRDEICELISFLGWLSQQ